VILIGRLSGSDFPNLDPIPPLQGGVVPPLPLAFPPLPLVPFGAWKLEIFPGIYQDLSGYMLHLVKTPTEYIKLISLVWVKITYIIGWFGY
jgi:hypothetical protein